MTTNCVAEYRDEGFAILEDDKGKYLAFADSLNLVDLGNSLDTDPERTSQDPVIPWLLRTQASN